MKNTPYICTMKKFIKVIIHGRENIPFLLFTDSLVDIIRLVLIQSELTVGEVKYYDNDGVDFDLSNLAGVEVLEIITHSGKRVPFSIYIQN